MPGNDSFGDFGVIDLKEKRLLPSFRFSLLRHFVTGTTDFHEFTHLDLYLCSDIQLIMSFINYDL